MAFSSAKNAVFSIDNGAGTPTDISAYCDKLELPLSVAMLDTTTFGASAETSVPGLKAGDKITGSGKLDPTLHTLLGTLYNNGGGLTSGNGSLSAIVGPMGSTSGNPKFTAETFLSKYQTGADVKGLAVFSFEFTITGGATSTAY